MIYKNKKNIYEVKDGVVYVYRENGEYVFCADEEDIPKFNMWSWHKDTKGYAVGGSGSSGRMYKVHRLIMDCNGQETVDHISRDKTDNRKVNLRSCSYHVNNQNRGHFRNNTSGAKGVYWDKYNECWRAGINIDGKQKMLGSFKTFEEAAAVRKKYERAIYGLVGESAT